MTPDSYLTIKEKAQIEIPKIKGSRSIGEAYPAATVEQALSCIEATRKREHSASHHCFAFRLNPDGGVYRSSDTGEPGGSAGRPILLEIEGRKLTNVVVVVTRYFGGTRLGIGGLVRAYGSAAGTVLDAAGLIERIRLARIEIQFDYDLTSVVLRTLGRYSAAIVSQQYSEFTASEVDLPFSKLEALQITLRDATSGRVDIRQIEHPDSF